MDNNPVNLTDVLGDCTDCKKERQESDSEKNKGFWGSVRGFLGFDKNGDASYLLDEIVITATKKEPSQQKQEQTKPKSLWSKITSISKKVGKFIKDLAVETALSTAEFSSYYATNLSNTRFYVVNSVAEDFGFSRPFNRNDFDKTWDRNNGWVSHESYDLFKRMHIDAALFGANFLGGGAAKNVGTTVVKKKAAKEVVVEVAEKSVDNVISDQVIEATLDKVARYLAAKEGSNLWKVGAYNELKGLEAGLQAHHVGQKSLMGRLVPGYNPSNAPSILVPEIGHVTNMPGIGRVASTRGGGGFTNARQVLSRDIFELRRVYGGQGIPNSSLQQLIQMNKTMYPGAFIK